MEPFKNNLSSELVVCIAGHLARHLDEFDRSAFEVSILNDLSSLELKERVQLIADHIHDALPCDYTVRYQIIREILHPVTDTNGALQSDENGICGWGMMPLGLVVGRHGGAAFEESLLLLKEMTKRFSSEFDVRYFLLADQDRALNIMKKWIGDPNRHVRRLVSEGTRPRLPWAMQLPKLVAAPYPTLPLLEALRDDPEEYVRRSVANHLNDIAKDHPDLVADLAKDWMQGADKVREKLVRHACRTLIKQGHPVALEAFGVRAPEIELQKLSIATDIMKLGDTLIFTADICSTAARSQSLIIDYLVHFKKANGKQKTKVFKWKKLTLKAEKIISITRSHPIRPITTRRYYEGRQALSLRINGQDFGFEEFFLLM
ncbi:MAG: DNA alkylation repair protein [Gammaproteobacteria bacterium]|nr:DNA alkylation repair protein [Gammaproteobacteria bacterium]